MQTEATIFIIDDDEMARTGVAALVSQMGLKGEAFASAEEFLESGACHRPGCLITDVRMVGMSGVELQERLAQEHCQMPIILLTGYASTSLAVQAMRRGAVTVLEKPCQENDLWEAIHRALQVDGEQRRKEMERREVAERFARLSSDERAVMERMIDGKPNKVIAAELDVSLRTIELRRHNLFEKTRTASVAELVKLVLQLEGPKEES